MWVLSIIERFINDQIIIERIWVYVGYIVVGSLIYGGVYFRVNSIINIVVVWLVSNMFGSLKLVYYIFIIGLYY